MSSRNQYSLYQIVSFQHQGTVDTHSCCISFSGRNLENSCIVHLGIGLAGVNRGNMVVLPQLVYFEVLFLPGNV